MPLALITFHHLLSARKIGLLQSQAADLALSGIFKRGYPGLLLVSSPTDSSEPLVAYVREVKRMRWQYVRLCGISETLRRGDDDEERGRPGLREVGSVKEFVATARTEDERQWIRVGLGFGKG
ncbi:hypothetical protein HKX48_009004 [Thoreauomyces humboldtii]|nr:hypothetical protein HKX48_009004 [Thoreauomyces humboldtii]